MKRPISFEAFSLGDVGAVLRVSAGIVLVFVIATSLAPDTVQRVSQDLLHATATNVGWLYLLVTTGFVVFVLVLALSRMGSIRLGPADAPPEFSFPSWLAMIFSGGR